MRCDVLPGLPPYGPLARNFGGRGHSEGMVVRFIPAQGESWIGNFCRGIGGADAVVQHPDQRRIIVIASGAGYVVDPEEPEKVVELPGAIQAVLELPDLKRVLFCEQVTLSAVNGCGEWWHSPRLSWDGFRSLRMEGPVVHGEAWTPDGDSWIPFTVDLSTGKCDGGSYPGRPIQMNPS